MSSSCRLHWRRATSRCCLRRARNRGREEPGSHRKTHTTGALRASLDRRPRLAEIGADDLLILLDRSGRPFGDLAAEIERDDLVRDRHHETHVMLDEEHADLPVVADTADQPAELEDFLVRKTAGGLV